MSSKNVLNVSHKFMLLKYEEAEHQAYNIKQVNNISFTSVMFSFNTMKTFSGSKDDVATFLSS